MLNRRSGVAQSLAFQRLCGFFRPVYGGAAAYNRCDVVSASLGTIGPILFHYLPVAAGSCETCRRKDRRVRQGRTLRYPLPAQSLRGYGPRSQLGLEGNGRAGLSPAAKYSSGS